MNTKEETIAPLDPIEGSDDLDMMTISVNFEGSYPQLVKFVNLLDRSPRFLIIESMQVAPQPKGDMLNVNLKLNAFVKDDTGGASVKIGRRTEESRHPRRASGRGRAGSVFQCFRGRFRTRASTAAPPPAPRSAPSMVATSRTAAARRRIAGTQHRRHEFKPRQGAERPEDRPDPATIDPTLRLDLLAKVQNVEPASRDAQHVPVRRRASPPPPKPIELPKNAPKIAVNQPPPAPPAGPPGRRLPPSAPPMTFKYYGYKVSKIDGRKQAFLLDGDDIIIAGENEAVKRGRYKVVKIGVNSITIEDTQFKSTQTLPLQEEAGWMRQAPAQSGIRLRAAVRLRHGRHRRDHALHGTAARRLRSAARQRTVADRSRRAVLARRPALRPQIQPLSRRFRRARKHPEPPLPAPPIRRPDDRQETTGASSTSAPAASSPTPWSTAKRRTTTGRPRQQNFITEMQQTGGNQTDPATSG